MSDQTDPPAQPTKVPRVQMNVRIPEDLRDEVDARRARKDMSRDLWVERALRFALAYGPGPTRSTRPRQR